ncbi:MAG: hypothetical protein JW841_04490 [Deltaproteobacteria bacterium]|nr:hypothetical protein [Deltaproteobacteria bacterium]
MKATVEINDELFVAAKKRAAELHKPLRSLIERGLRAELGRQIDQPLQKDPRKIRWITVDGGLPNDIDISNRASMHDWLRKQK